MDKGIEILSKEMVSIIIPVYNVAEFLEECVNSVISQTYENLEVILVDDGSIDKSGSICDFYKQKDERIKVVHKENGGQSDARNVGIQMATGKYLYFLDSDDILAKEAIYIMVNVAEKSDCDVVMSAAQVFKKKVPKNPLYIADKCVVDIEEAMKRMFLHMGLGHEPWGKLFDRKIWDMFRFPVGKIYEDYALLYKVIASCHKVAIIGTPLYFYRIRQGSTMNSAFKEKEFQIFEVSNSVTEFITNEMPNLKDYAEYLQLVTYLKTMKRILDCGFNRYEEEQRIIVDYTYSCKELVKKKWVKRTDKIKVWTLLLSKRLFYYIYDLAEKKNAIAIK